MACRLSRRVPGFRQSSRRSRPTAPFAPSTGQHVTSPVSHASRRPRCQACKPNGQEFHNNTAWHNRQAQVPWADGCPTSRPRCTAASATATHQKDRSEGRSPAPRGERHQSTSRRTYQSSGRGQQRAYKPAINQDFFARESWAQAGANESMIEALNSIGLSRPSHVQAEALQASFTGGRRVVVADQAGSGKTLAYLVPLVQRLKEAEAEAGRLTQPRCPRAVIICPTEELCVQVLYTARALSKVLRFRAQVFTGGHKMSQHRRTLQEGVDVAVCTSGRLQQLLDAGHLDLSSCQTLVLDEVDVLLGDQGAFAAEVLPLVDSAPEEASIVFVTATLPEPVFVKLKGLFPGILAAIGPNLHKIAPGVTEQLVDCSGGGDVTLAGGTRRKLAALWALLQAHAVPHTIVFCNKIDACRAVENFLLRQDRRGHKYAVLPYHDALDRDIRTRNLRSFLTPPAAGAQQRVLVCTDRASRGIDSAHVEHVVLFDFPRDPSEYVRRAGRTARGAAGRGRVSVLVLGRQVQLAQEIIDRNEKGVPVHVVPSMRDTDVVVDAPPRGGGEEVPTAPTEAEGVW
eukprot:jgi/Ulvmu1/8507/UM044_0041.1